MTATYLDKILDFHRQRAAADRRDAAELRDGCAELAATRGFGAALVAPGLSVIAEIKRRSPSKGDLAPDLDAAEVARDYEAGGATCLSVLTDAEHFGGSTADLRAAHVATALPVLRKDFTMCLLDVLDTRLMGADAVLLIVAALTDEQLGSFSSTAADIGLAAVFEIHDEAELERALAADAPIIGVNQRDLVTFAVDQERAVRMAPQIPAERVRIAESGVRGPQDAAVLYAAGYDAVLVGESVVTATGRADAVRALRSVTGELD